ncbi:MAG: arsenate reductase ArsC [Chitinophagales bacterium]
MTKQNVLFVCVHNSARSQIAEALLNKIGGDQFTAESAGLEPGSLNPLAVEVMKEEGVDISNNPTKDVFGFFKQSLHFHYVITVCDGASAERCPVFPGVTKRLNWSFKDPSKFEGTLEEKLEQTRKVREEIRTAITTFIENAEKGNYKFS